MSTSSTFALVRNSGAAFTAASAPSMTDKAAVTVSASPAVTGAATHADSSGGQIPLTMMGARAARLAEIDRLDDEGWTWKKPSSQAATGPAAGPGAGDNDGDDHGDGMLDEAESALMSSSTDTPASIDRPLPADNVGYRLLQRMGWSGYGRGIGKRGQGITEPIRLDVETGQMGAGLGKGTEYIKAAAEATRDRKKLALETQLTETPEQRQAREAAAAHTAEISAAVASRDAIFRCDDCDKQYSNAAELNTHLTSYDHHHVVRMRATRRQDNARRLGGAPADVDAKRERRQQEEDRRLEAQMRAAAETASRIAASATSSATATVLATVPTAALATTAAAPAPVGFASKPISMSITASTAKVGFSLPKKSLGVQRPAGNLAAFSSE